MTDGPDRIGDDGLLQPVRNADLGWLLAGATAGLALAATAVGVLWRRVLR